MGYGDDIMASGMARGAQSRGKRIAFGDGKKIIWGPWSADIFRGNPNVAHPGDEGQPDIEWIDHYKGHRHYNKMVNRRWIWNMQFRPYSGEIFFSEEEATFADAIPRGFILIEPNVPVEKSVAVNKQWPIERFQEVADRLKAEGRRVVQTKYKGARHQLRDVEQIETASFRYGLAVLARSAIFVGHEGGMHHGAAALGIPGVVIFGGFIPPQVTGYLTHINLTGGGTIGCGRIDKCDHCRAAMEAITVADVLHGVWRLIGKR